MKTTKNFLIASVVVCALTLALFHHALICFGVQHYVKAHLPESHTVSFAFSKGKWDQGDFVFQGVTLSCHPKEERQGLKVKVDNLRFSFHFRLFPFQFSPKFTFSRPEFDMADIPVPKKESGSNVYQSIERQLFHIPISVEQGEVNFGKDRSKVAYFSFESAMKNHPGFIALSDSLEGLSHPKFSAEFSKGKEGVLFDFRFNDFRLNWAEELVAYFSPEHSPDSIKFHEGILCGHLAFGLSPTESIDYLRYDIDMRELKLSALKWGIDLAAHRFHWEEHAHKSGARDSRDPLWLQLLGEGDLSCGVVTVNDSKTGQPCGSVELSAKVTRGSGGVPSVACHGIFQDGREETPFQMALEARRRGQIVDQIACDFHFFSTCEGKVYTEWTKSEKEAGLWQVSAGFEGLNHSLLTFIKRVSETHYPSLSQVTMESGILSGELLAFLNSGALHQLEVKELRGEHLRCYLPSHELYANAKQVSGSGEFDWSSGDFFDGTFWNVKVDGCVIQLPSGVKLEEVDANIAMHDQYVKPSTISGLMNGIEGELHFEGLYNHLNFDVHSAVSSEDLKKWMGLKEESLPTPVIEKLAFDLHGRVKSIEDQLCFNGNVELLQVHDKNDQVFFDVRLDCSNLIAGEFSALGLQKAFISCDFDASHFSERAIDLTLWLSGKPWKSKGSVDVKGSVSKERFKLQLDPTYFTLISSDVTIEQTIEPDEVCPAWNFTFDFQKGLWEGSLPLKHVSLDEKPIGLHFSPFDADLKIEGDLLTFRSVSAFSQGVLFQGDVTIDYGLKDRVDLKVITSHIEGTTDQVCAFFGQFKEFAHFAIPIEGRVLSHTGEMKLHADLMGEGKLLDWNLTLHLEDGRSQISSNVSLQNLTGELTYHDVEKSLNLSQGSGEVLLSGGVSPKQFQLNVPSASFNQSSGQFSFDTRLETATYDILCLKGDGGKESNLLSITLDSEKTHFFGTKGDISNLIIDLEEGVRAFNFQGSISASDLGQQLELLCDAGALPVGGESMNKLLLLPADGEISCEINYHHEQEQLSFKGIGERFSFGTIQLGPLNIHGQRDGNHFHLSQCEVGGLKVDLEMWKRDKYWEIPSLGLQKQGVCCKIHEGRYDSIQHTLSVSIDEFFIDLQSLISELPFPKERDWSYYSGQFRGEAVCDLDFSHGIKDLRIATTMNVVGEDVGKGRLNMECPRALKLSYSSQEGFQLKNGDCHFFSPMSNQVWAKCHFDELGLFKRTWKGGNICLVLPPEMVQYLGATGSLPFLRSEGKAISIAGATIPWENQMEVTLDIEWGETFTGLGRLKEGYYWIKDQAWYLNDFTFNYANDVINLSANTCFNDLPFDVTAQVQMQPKVTSQIVIQETLKEEVSYRAPLTIQGSWRNGSGFVIDRAEGHLLGLDVSMTYNPKDECDNKYILSGGIQIDFSRLSKGLPTKLKEEIAAFEVGKGFELVGDLFLGKESLHDFNFRGYFRGKHFHLFGSEMETLLSEVAISPDGATLSQFNMSDEAGIFSVKELDVGRMSDGKWSLKIPELSIQDFRPSLLKKIGRYRGRIKPLMIKQLHFNDIRGTLGSVETFTGKGDLHFINTFKRDYTLLDIPLEILGRLGLDMGLLVPTRGHVDFVMVDGKVYFVDLANSYSEGKRSEFFLASEQPSYIDFEGNLNLNIRMKQYVLLKLTQPFILSIGGTFENPKYSLR